MPIYRLGVMSVTRYRVTRYEVTRYKATRYKIRSYEIRSYEIQGQSVFYEISQIYKMKSYAIFTGDI